MQGVEYNTDMLLMTGDAFIPGGPSAMGARHRTCPRQEEPPSPSPNGDAFRGVSGRCVGDGEGVLGMGTHVLFSPAKFRTARR